MQQATDFLDESEALSALLAPLSDAELETHTQFKGWTINNIIRHLHVWNIAADLALSDEAAFGEFIWAACRGMIWLPHGLRNTAQ
jgi:Mycothiol maleylpyruvate isomerase N-terminal domain